ncbi:hypothetical protein V1522DRAFT_394250 [Lipomyces starkeyi]
MDSKNSQFICDQCMHTPFETKIQLTKHISRKHREAQTFVFKGETYTLVSNDDGKYLCPKCTSQISTIRYVENSVRHLVLGNSAWTQAEVVRAVAENEAASTHGDVLAQITDCRTVADLGFTIEQTWQVSICTRCKFVVDKAMWIEHIEEKHSLQVANADAVWLVARMYNLRPYLAIVWDESTEDQLDESDDEQEGTSQSSPGAFRPGSAPLEGIPVHDGLKCQLCNHRGQTVDYHPVHVQTFYGRSKHQSQLRYVEVSPTESSDRIPLSVFGIPDDVHSVPGQNSTITERKDLNQFGIKFQDYTLLDIVNLSDLGNLLHKAEDQSFEVLKGLCLRMLVESGEDTKAGFQPMLGKVMVGEPEKYVNGPIGIMTLIKRRDFFYEV